MLVKAGVGVQQLVAVPYSSRSARDSASAVLVASTDESKIAAMVPHDLDRRCFLLDVSHSRADARGYDHSVGITQ